MTQEFVMLPRDVVEQALDAFVKLQADDDVGLASWDFAEAGNAFFALREALEQPQGKLEPVTLPQFNTWSSNEGDSWHDYPTDAQIIEDVFGGETPVVGAEYEVSAGWHCVTATYRITWVSGDGDYEAECISHQQENAASQPKLEPLTDEQIAAATGAKPGTPMWLVAVAFTRAIEAAHNIK